MAGFTKTTVEVEIKEDVTAKVSVQINAAEPSVGIMGCYIDEWFVEKIVSGDETLEQINTWIAAQSRDWQERMEDELLELTNS